MTMTKADVIKEITEYFEDNEEVWNDCIEELDSYNGWLGDDRYYDIDYLDECFYGRDVYWILCRAYYGHDADTWTENSRGEKEYGAFNPNRNYFYFNGYGNLVSTDYKDYSDFLDDYAIESMAENRRDIYTIADTEELSELFDKLEAIESEETDAE